MVEYGCNSLKAIYSDPLPAAITGRCAGDRDRERPRTTLVVAPASIFDPAVPVIGNVIYGDSDEAISGAALAQTFLFVSGSNFVYGDAAAIAGRGQGGDEYLHNQGRFSEPFGDARYMLDQASGGDDVVSGSRFGEVLYGDAEYMYDQSSAGDDVLLDGPGDDVLYGDARVFNSTGARGADRFVFAADCGRDMIGDFQPGIDVIDLRPLGYASFAQLIVGERDGDSVVDLPGPNRITVNGIAHLTAADFLLA